MVKWSHAEEHSLFCKKINVTPLVAAVSCANNLVGKVLCLYHFCRQSVGKTRKWSLHDDSDPSSLHIFPAVVES